jgi:hypothetical protein
VDNEEKCPVSGKRKYATEGEALATAQHQMATGNAPGGLRGVAFDEKHEMNREWLA